LPFSSPNSRIPAGNIDDKLKELIKLLRTDKDLKNRKVLIFSEFAETARY